MEKSNSCVGDYESSSSHDDLEERSLLGHSNDSNPTIFSPFSRIYWKTYLVTATPWLLNIGLLTALAVVGLQSPDCRPTHNLRSYTPAQEVIEYQKVIFQGGFGKQLSPYQGWPTDDKDYLWEEMYDRGVTVHIDAESYAQLDPTDETIQVPMPGYEDDYLVGLEVFHQLHCLNTLRKGYYPHRYNVTLIREDRSVDYLEWMHIDHCIESIRQYLVCHADTSIIAYEWLGNAKYTRPRLDTAHTCRNFEKIQTWAFERWLPFTNKRNHVENGVIVDYTGFGSDPEALENLDIPKNWSHTVDEM